MKDNNLIDKWQYFKDAKRRNMVRQMDEGVFGRLDNRQWVAEKRKSQKSKGLDK